MVLQRKNKVKVGHFVTVPRLSADRRFNKTHFRFVEVMVDTWQLFLNRDNVQDYLQTLPTKIHLSLYIWISAERSASWTIAANYWLTLCGRRNVQNLQIVLKRRKTITLGLLLQRKVNFVFLVPQKHSLRAQTEVIYGGTGEFMSKSFQWSGTRAWTFEL